jgi:Na+/H+-dicarboxylate symporter
MSNLLMLLGLVLGLALGLTASGTGSPTLLAIAEGVEPLGQIFIRALQMVVIPMVMALVFAAVARLGDLRSLGRIGGRALAFIWTTTFISIVMGMGLMGLALKWFPPEGIPAPTGVQVPVAPGVVEFLVNLVPSNPFAAASSGALLPLLVFTVLFGAAAGRLEGVGKDRLITLAEAVSGACVQLVLWVLVVAPLGIFGLAAPATARMGLGLLWSLGVFVATVIIALFLFMALIYLPAVRYFGGVTAGRFIRVSMPSYTMGFTTTSGMPTLPLMLRDTPDLGVSDRVTQLIIPMAVPLDRAGSALFQGAAVVFIAALYGVDVPSAAWIGGGIATFFAAATIAPIPSASIMTLAPALTAVGAPLDGLGLLLAIDRVPDMFRSGTNMAGHMAAAVVAEGQARSPAPVADASEPS